MSQFLKVSDKYADNNHKILTLIMTNKFEGTDYFLFNKNGLIQVTDMKCCYFTHLIYVNSLSHL